ncbi:MAG: right-handed parallel beta-helix repeat-containing protein [Acidobacteriaceae bacterium]
MKNRLLLAIFFLVPGSLSLQAITLHVGPGSRYATPCAALKVAADGDTILVDSGVYKGDVCAFSQNNLTIRGIGPTRPHVEAAGKIAENRGIWVFHGNNFTVENMEFSGAHISPQAGNNGSGLGAKGANWTVRNCYFHDNQDGILESNIRQSHILIEYSEFARNGAGDGQSHNLYIGTTASLVFRFNYSHDASVGHLLKTRAAVNYVLYNRLSGESGTDSYEINVPNGGTTYVIGNLIEQGPNSQNPAMLDYLSEGIEPANAGNDLYVVNNTFVNDLPNGGPFIQVSSQDKFPVLVQNNIFYGPGKIINQPDAILKSNFTGNPSFVDDKKFDYRLKPGSPVIGRATPPGLSLDEYPLLPNFEYLHPACGERRLNARDIGALSFHGSGEALRCR